MTAAEGEIGAKLEPQQQQQIQQQDEALERIYLAPDGLTSACTIHTYSQVFNRFIQITIKNDNLRTLLETKQSVVESKIINHINHLKDTRRLSYLSIQIHLSDILRFFAMNDYHLNIKKAPLYHKSDKSLITFPVYELSECVPIAISL